MNQAAPQIRLGTEELVLLLGLMRFTHLPGMRLAEFGQLPEAEARTRLATADHSLRARGLVTVQADDNKILIDPQALLLVGTSALAQTGIGLTRQTKNGYRATHYWHLFESLWVQHSNPELGVHQFEAIGNIEAVLARLKLVTGLEDQPAVSTAAFSLAREALVGASEAAVAGRGADCRQILQQAGLAQDTIELFASTLADLTSKTLVEIVSRGPDKNASASAVVFFESPAGLWELVVGEPQQPLQIVPRTGRQVLERLRERVEEALHAQP